MPNECNRINLKKHNNKIIKNENTQAKLYIIIFMKFLLKDSVN